MTIEDHRFPCDNCGADFRFAPDTGALTCDHCGNTQHVTDSAGPGAIAEMRYDKGVLADLAAEEIEETRVSSCPNCNAQVEFDPDTHATECPFCATPVVTDTGTHRHIKPKALLPFSLDEKTARAAMSDWLGGLWFAPNGLQDYARKGRKLQGIYVPYWTYDANTKTRYSGERGDHYYVTRTVGRDGKSVSERQRKTRWRPASGRVARFFDDVLVLGSTSLPKKYTDNLEPWDLNGLAPYQPEFLAGFRAEGYTVPLEDGFDEAQSIMARQIERDIRFDIGGDTQRIHSRNTQMNDITFKHILLPVWLAAYKFRGKTYRFVVNGSTGRVQGERPWSVIKIALAVIFGAVIAGAIGFALSQAQ